MYLLTLKSESPIASSTWDRFFFAPFTDSLSDGGMISLQEEFCLSNNFYQFTNSLYISR